MGFPVKIHRKTECTARELVRILFTASLCHWVSFWKGSNNFQHFQRFQHFQHFSALVHHFQHIPIFPVYYSIASIPGCASITQMCQHFPNVPTFPAGLVLSVFPIAFCSVLLCFRGSPIFDSLCNFRVSAHLNILLFCDFIIHFKQIHSSLV